MTCKMVKQYYKMALGNERTFEKVSQDEIQDKDTLKLIIVKVKGPIKQQS